MQPWTAELRDDQDEALEELRKSRGMNKSQTVRFVVDEWLDRYEAEDDDSEQPEPRPADSADQNNTNSDIIRGNEPIIIGFAFLLGFQDILSALTTVGGDLGRVLFIVFGLSLSAWIFYDIFWNANTDSSKVDESTDGVEA